jgi:hypothetical protein
MNRISLLPLAAAVVLVTPLVARADVKPHFDVDAKPILSEQPGLIEFVESRFEVKDVGMSKYPGDSDHAPLPPYIFNARPRGSSGPYNLRLLVQPGAPGHILGIVDATKIHPSPVTSSSAQQQPAPANQPAPAMTQQPPALTSDVPSGPITNSNSAQTTPTPSNLTPPADPVPAPH